MVVAVTFFIFALIIGIAVIGRVPATLHTPLMSGANSIHGVVLVGVIIVGAQSNSLLGNILVFFAALLGTLNVVGGYVVTDRMLEMFKPKPAPLEFDPDLEFAESDGSQAVEVSVTEVIKNDPILAKSVFVEPDKEAVDAPVKKDAKESAAENEKPKKSEKSAEKKPAAKKPAVKKPVAKKTQSKETK